MLFAIVAPQVAHSELIQFYFDGIFESSIPDTSLDSGDRFLGSFILDSAAAISQLSASTERYDGAISTFDFSLDGVTAELCDCSPQIFVTTAGTSSLQIRFNFDGSISPFDGAGSGSIGRFEVIYGATGLLGTDPGSANLSTLDIGLLSTLAPESARVLVFGGDDSNILFDSAGIEVVNIPEPSAIALLFVGIAGLGVARRRVRNSFN